MKDKRELTTWKDVGQAGLARGVGHDPACSAQSMPDPSLETEGRRRQRQNDHNAGPPFPWPYTMHLYRFMGRALKRMAWNPGALLDSFLKHSGDTHCCA